MVVGVRLLSLSMSNNLSGDSTCEDGVKNSIDLYASASYILIVISALIVIIAFFGCCGAYKVTLIIITSEIFQ